MQILPKAWTRLKTDPHETILKGRSFRLAHANGLFEAAFQLSDKDREELERRSKAIDTEWRATIDASAEVANNKILQAKGEAAIATNAAHNARDAAKWQLFNDFFRLPSREQIAITETKVDHVVIAPAPVEGEATATA